MVVSLVKVVANAGNRTNARARNPAVKTRWIGKNRWEGTDVVFIEQNPIVTCV
jgi:hypothetical protein